MHLGEIRQTFRRLGKSRGFSCSVVLTLALGIGATVSVFSIIHAVMITPLPYDDPSRLFSVFDSKCPTFGTTVETSCPPDDFEVQNSQRCSRAGRVGSVRSSSDSDSDFGRAQRSGRR